MITEKQYNEAIVLIKQYKKEQLELSRIERGKTATTSIPVERWDVHQSHCCFEHGCKYGDDDCPVELGLIIQKHQCEDCNDEIDGTGLRDWLY